MARGKVVLLRGLPVELVNRAKAVAAFRGKPMVKFLTEKFEEIVDEETRKIHEEVRVMLAEKKRAGC